jgi:hypothetical protein
VSYPEVEQDLALTHEQKDALKAISQKVAAYEKRMFAEQTGPPRTSSPRENRQWHLQKYEAAYEMLAGARQEIAKTLTPSQMTTEQPACRSQCGSIVPTDIVKR